MRLKKENDCIESVDLVVAPGAKKCRMMVVQAVFVQAFTGTGEGPIYEPG
jgi:hypothetical protein